MKKTSKAIRVRVIMMCAICVAKFFLTWLALSEVALGFAHMRSM